MEQTDGLLDGGHIDEANSRLVEIPGIDHRRKDAVEQPLLDDNRDHFFLGLDRKSEQPKSLSNALPSAEDNRRPLSACLERRLHGAIGLPALDDRRDQFDRFVSGSISLR
jgi:hypothetical protein